MSGKVGLPVGWSDGSESVYEAPLILLGHFYSDPPTLRHIHPKKVFCYFGSHAVDCCLCGLSFTPDDDCQLHSKSQHDDQFRARVVASIQNFNEQFRLMSEVQQIQITAIHSYSRL